jgi:diguanylate cyclase (GGDEF)-like protein/PAS domain S-box-containing protein
VASNHHGFFKAVFRQTAFPLILTRAGDRSGTHGIVACNAAFTAITGYLEADLLDREPTMLLSERGQARVIERIRQQPPDGEIIVDVTVRRKDGSEYPAEWHLSPVFDDERTITHYLHAHRDISAEQQNRRFRDTLIAALDNAEDAILITDEKDALQFANRGFERISGYTTDEAMGLSLMTLLRPERVDWETLEPDRRAPEAEEEKGAGVRALFRFVRKDGSPAYIDASIVDVHDENDEVVRRVSGWKDMSEVAARGRQVLEQAATDELTGLLNRHAGQSRVESMLAVATARHPFSIVMADVDGFKRVNDEHGHQTGDRVLAAVAREIHAVVRTSDAVVRWGGDEFVLLLPGAKADPAAWLAERARMVVAAKPDPEAGVIRMSFGVAQWTPGEDFESLLERADAALYTAKATGGDRVQLAATLVHH